MSKRIPHTFAYNKCRPATLDSLVRKMVVNYCILLQGKAKWDAWNGKKGMSQDEAKQKYIEYAKQMLEKHGARPE
jgi:hypothetical protein